MEWALRRNEGFGRCRIGHPCARWLLKPVTVCVPDGGHEHIGLIRKERELITMKIKMIALACAVGLVGAACGGDGDDGDQALIDALAASINAEGDDTFEGIELDEQCAAKSLVDAVGGAEAAESEYGITVESVESDAEFDPILSQEHAEAFVDGFWECGDMMGAMTAGMAEDGAMSEEDAACLTENLDPDVFKTALAAEFMGPEGDALMDSAVDDSFTAIFDAMIACDIQF